MCKVENIIWRMKKCVIYLFCAFFGASQALRDCRVSIDIACENHTIPHNFPETEKELDAFCKDLAEGLECYIDFEGTCSNDSLSLDRIRKLLDFSKDVCDKSTPLYTAIAYNLKCAKPVMQESDDKCGDFPSEDKLATYFKILLDKGMPAIPGNERNTMYCLRHFYITACLAKEIEKCGKDAVDTFNSISRKSFAILLENCGDKIASYYGEIISVFNDKE